MKIKSVYPNIDSDGLSLFESQVQFRGRVWGLRLFRDLFVLFHPPEKEQERDRERNSIIIYILTIMPVVIHITL